MKKSFRIIALLLALVMCTALFAGCKKDPANEKTTPLVVGYLQFSEKFSPFFAKTGYDQDVASMTQLTLLTTDRVGGIVENAIEGETRKYNGTDYKYTGMADVKIEKKSDVTVYTMKIRDDIKFSDGEKMTADDIIFTYYVLSDKTYTGSSTLYSMPILGMMNYRYNNSLAETTEVTADEIAAALKAPTADMQAAIKDSIIVPTLTDELDWAKGYYDAFDDETKAKYKENGVENGVDFYLYCYAQEEIATEGKTEEDILAAVIAQYGYDYKALGLGYAGDEAYFAGDAEAIVSEFVLVDKLASGDGKAVNNIEGIKKIDEYTVEVTTKGFDATAIYQIAGIQVAPMHYYGDKAQYDYDNNKFGFPREDLSLIEAKTTKPMGAGAYKFVEYKDKVVYFEANENYYKGTPKTKYIQFKETTDADKIPGVGTGTIDVSDPSGSVANFAQISGYNTNKELTGNKITTNTVDNLGYGYIGINAETVKVGGKADSAESKNLRKALATVLAVYRDVAIDSYYGEVASVINYPISNTSWAAPQKSDSDYEVAYSKDVSGNALYTSTMSADDKYAAALTAALGFFEAAGYTVKDGKLTAAPEGAKLEYEIIIPADGAGDHPSFAILTYAKEALAKIGFNLIINDPADSNILWDKIEAGTQELWVAAWGATIDPDMYQVYHSSNAVGAGGTDSNSYNIKDANLDKAIMDARQSDDQAFRKATYKTCLDTILDWGVEIPVYQRQNCLIFSTERVKIDTITPDITTFWGWMQDIELIEMN